MTRDAAAHADDAWQRFVLAHGHRAAAGDLAFILRRPAEEICRLRATEACSKSARRKGFIELFRLWHGREPSEEDWPPPRKSGRGQYEWQGPEFAILASLVGRLGTTELAQVLTERLRRLTGDPTAARSRVSLHVTINRIGMQAKDVVGGLTTAAAGREIGSLPIIQHAICQGDLRALRV